MIHYLFNTSKRRVMLQVLLVLFLCSSKNNVTLKIVIELIINLLLNFDQIIILRVTLLFKKYKNNLKKTFIITCERHHHLKKDKNINRQLNVRVRR
jgi:hypothetical protein